MREPAYNDIVSAHGGRWLCVATDERGPLFVRESEPDGIPQRLVNPVVIGHVMPVTSARVPFGPGAGLTIALSAAVPLRVMEYKARGGPDDTDRDRARAFAQVLGERGDVLQYGGKPGEAADLFNRLADGLAVLAFQPGGVKAFGEHWQG